MNFLNMDRGIYKILSKTTDIVWINLLTVIFSLPIITMGASFTAMYYVLMKMSKNEEGYVTKNFLKAFRLNFKHATLIWIGICGLVLLVLTELAILRNGSAVKVNNVNAVVWGAILIIAIIIYMICLYVFPLLARYDNGIKLTLKNAYLFVFGFLPQSLLMAVLTLIPVICVVVSPFFLFFWVFFGFALPGYFSSRILIHNFEIAEKRTQKKA